MGEKFLPEKLRKKKALYHTTSDIGQDGLVSISSAAYKDNGSQPLNK